MPMTSETEFGLFDCNLECAIPAQTRCNKSHIQQVEKYKLDIAITQEAKLLGGEIMNIMHPRQSSRGKLNGEYKQYGRGGGRGF